MSHVQWRAEPLPSASGMKDTAALDTCKSRPGGGSVTRTWKHHETPTSSAEIADKPFPSSACRGAARVGVRPFQQWPKPYVKDGLVKIENLEMKSMLENMKQLKSKDLSKFAKLLSGLEMNYERNHLTNGYVGFCYG
ncbi:predicted protein [Histoplasma capsulatum G186AR]|uniref:Uncharacterized protein n=1 Tax=Ajellomyces capsulatus (strain G186AR / H82 / ATCC MYA-2454 / RMSCC 2432) TaxID=447093 RepID=C0NPT5_AJECG|nr:uncharacterized protein HCBG_05165 [Histoplasma capsulatum G186AR]EEH06945.1 predicted protein [Histoplasma capsulatum G186AR]